MNKNLKKTLTILFIAATLLATGYGAYKLYHYVIEDATKRIQKGVAKGVSKGLVGTINPFKW